MLVTCLPLWVALFVGLPSTVTAQTLDRQKLEISGAVETNQSPGDFGYKHLSKHQTHSDEDSSKLNELKSPILHNLGNAISQKSASIGSKDEIRTVDLNLGVPGREWRASIISKKSVHSTLAISPCPDETAIAPCVCTVTDANELMMDCSAVESETQLAAVFMQKFPFNQFKEFRIENNNNIQYLSDIFNGVSFRYIYLRVPNLTEVTKGAFADSKEYLENIYIYQSVLTEDTFPFSTLHEYSKLTFLRITLSNIYIFPTFHSSSLETVIITYGQIPVLLQGKMCDHLCNNLIIVMI